jgi:hypothetical protein
MQSNNVTIRLYTGNGSDVSGDRATPIKTENKKVHSVVSRLLSFTP